MSTVDGLEEMSPSESESPPGWMLGRELARRRRRPGSRARLNDDAIRTVCFVFELGWLCYGCL
jgi:hypothetical protein